MRFNLKNNLPKNGAKWDIFPKTFFPKSYFQKTFFRKKNLPNLTQFFPNLIGLRGKFFCCTLLAARTKGFCSGNWLSAPHEVLCNSEQSNCAGRCSGCSSAFLFIRTVSFSTSFSSWFGGWEYFDSVGPFTSPTSPPLTGSSVMARAEHSLDFAVLRSQYVLPFDARER